jgi:ubiquinone/menaquinone biosynthesis C-methylase UbiE
MKILLLAMLGISLAASASAAPPEPAAARFVTVVSPSYMDDPRRMEWQQPDKVLEHLSMKPGDIIADLGAGTGYFSLRFARKVGESGLVYALDVDAAMIDLIRSRAQRAKLHNIRPIKIAADDPGLAKASIDLIFICDTYLFLENRVTYLVNLREKLKPGGKLAIISFNTQAEVAGAPPPQMVIAKSQTVMEVEKAGFTLEADFKFLPFQDFLLFRDNDRMKPL